MAQVSIALTPTGGSAEANDAHFVATSSTRHGVAALDPWGDLEHWLSTMGLSEHTKKFHEHEITGKDMPFLTEARALAFVAPATRARSFRFANKGAQPSPDLKDMGIDSVGDRLKIVQMTEAYLRGLRNRQRQKNLDVVHSFTFMPVPLALKSKYQITESAVVVRTPRPFICSVDVDNVDISSIQEIKLEAGAFFSSLTISTSDPSVMRKGGKLRLCLTNIKGAAVHKLLKNLWDADKKKMHS